MFDISIAIVMGPTPPGTGVICPAIFDADSKWTSPTSLLPVFQVLSSMYCIPTSITIAPGFIHSPFTN